MMDKRVSPSKPRLEPLSSDAHHEVEFFKRHRGDDQAQAAPGLDALLGFPVKVRARLMATLAAVAKPRRSGSLAGASGKRCTAI